MQGDGLCGFETGRCKLVLGTAAYDIGRGVDNSGSPTCGGAQLIADRDEGTEIGTENERVFEEVRGPTVDEGPAEGRGVNGCEEGRG